MRRRRTEGMRRRRRRRTEEEVEEEEDGVPTLGTLGSFRASTPRPRHLASPPPVSPLSCFAHSPFQDRIAISPCISRGRRGVGDGMEKAIKCCLEFWQGWDRLDVVRHNVIQS